MSGEKSVLVVDDEEDVRSLVRELLERAGYRVLEARDGREGLRVLHEHKPDLIVLDVAMPELDGWQTLERIRDVSGVPVLMLTARTAELEKVRGLLGGADDYLTKPFGRQELVARVHSLLRRTREHAETTEAYVDSYLSIDYARRAVLVGDTPVSLTPLEFKLLSTLVRHPNQVLSRDQLVELVWDDPYAASTDQVKLYVSYLRRKLEDANGGTPPIVTQRGFGYRYDRPS